MRVESIAVVGWARGLIESELSKYGFRLDRKKPDVVISFGGDGTALYAEQLYPGAPKVLIKHSRTCTKCEEHDFSNVLGALRRKEFKIVTEMKVEGWVKGTRRRLVGLNEVNICHRDPTRAIRFSVRVNGKPVAENAIGDGVLVATPYGSTAYFYSITRRSFKRGLGIAFNNTRKKRSPKVVDENSVVEVEVLRGPAWLCADNIRRKYALKDGDVVVARRARQRARIVEVVGERRKIGF